MTYIKGLQENDLGSSVIGRHVTATLYVSPDGDDSDGSTKEKAYQTIQGALDAASTDVNDLTVILIAPHATFYDINTTGDPTWSCNVELISSHRRWAIIKNTNVSATSIFKFTGKASIDNLAIVHTGACNGVIFTQSSFRARRIGINSTGATSAVNGIHLDGTAGTLMGGIIEDVRIVGHVTYTTGIYLNNVSFSDFNKLDLHSSLIGVHVVHASSVTNFFKDNKIDGCATGFDLDAGDDQHFNNIDFHSNTNDILDTSGGTNTYRNITGEFGISIYPAGLTGTEITAGDTVYGLDTELIAAAAISTPFKIISYTATPSNAETTLIRFSADSGSTFFAESLFSSARSTSTGAGSGTDFIFNAGTRISASVHSPGAGRTVEVSVTLQKM